MTLFEYLAIAFTLVLSFSAMRLVAGLPYAVAAERRYWVHLAFVSAQLFMTIVAFWNLWNLHDVSWTLPKFLLVLASPGLIYFTSCALIPDQPSAVESWRAHYEAVRIRYFVGSAANFGFVFLLSFVVLGVPFMHPIRFFQSGIVAVFLAGALSSNPRVHEILALLTLLVVTAVASTVFLEPGAFSP